MYLIIDLGSYKPYIQSHITEAHASLYEDGLIEIYRFEKGKYEQYQGWGIWDVVNEQYEVPQEPDDFDDEEDEEV